MTEVRFQVYPPPEMIARLLGKMSKDVADFRPAWGALAPDLAEGLAKNITSRGANAGESWAQPAPSTLRRRPANRAQLRLTGELLSEVSRASSAVRRLTANELQVGTTKKHGYVQHFGVKGRLPARPWISWSDGMRKSALAKVEQHATMLLAKLSDDISRGSA